MADIVGTANGETLIGTSGADTIQGLGGDDFLYGGGGDDVVQGGDGDDYLQGGAGLDGLFGGNGNDTLEIFNLGDLTAGETYDGGIGTDLLVVNTNNGFPPVDLTGITIAGIEQLFAKTGQFRNEVRLTISQLQGFSAIAGGITLANGGSLNLSGVTLDASWHLSDNATTIDFTGSLSQFGDGAVVLGGAAADSITGSALGDYLYGNGGADTLSGGGGNDTLQGGTGIDAVNGGDGDDQIRFGSASDVASAETITGGNGYDTIYLYSDNTGFGIIDLSTSTLVGIEALDQDYTNGSGVRLTVAQLNGLQAFNRYIDVVGTGTVTLAGKNANNSVYTLADTVAGFDATGVIGTLSGVYAGNNDNALTGTDGFDYFDGKGGNDTITGKGGDDTLIGGAGNDSLTGGTGNDTLSGGDGIDQLLGGDGDDILKVDSTIAVTGEVYDGGAGNDKLDLNGGAIDLSQQTITGIEWLDAGPYATVGLTAAQFGGFSTLQGHFAIAGAGTVAFTGKTLYNFQLDLAAAGNTADFTGTSPGYLNVFGNAGADTVTGSQTNDYLSGMGGNDTLRGGGGNDTLTGGAGTDTQEGGAGNDLFQIQYASDLAAGEVYDGGDGFDTFKSTYIGDFDISGVTMGGIEKIDLTYPITLTLTTAQLDGFSDIGGGQFKLSTAGSVSLAGVASAGAYFALSDAGNTIDLRGFAQNGTQVTGGAGNDTVWGTAGNDIVTTGDGSDWLSGGDGNDSLSGGTGIDTFYGGAGNDTYLLDDAAELVFEAVGEGTDQVYTSASHYLFANVENLALTGGANLFGVGNDLANTINGNAGANLLIGGGGGDTLIGGAGNDSLFGESGADNLYGDSGIDYIAGGTGNDFLQGGDDADNLYGEDGDDYLHGGTSFHTDIMTGGAGNDTLYGISGQANPDYDLMDGGAGDDIYYVDTGADLTFEAVDGGIDTVHANVPVANAGVYLYANVENLVLEGTTAFGVGNELDNRLTGSASANRLLGGAGNDRLEGMAGNDVLFGQAGADTFVFGAGSGQDVIGDFVHGTDKIRITGIFADFAQAHANFVQNGSDGAINLGGGNFVVLQGVTMSTLDATDFIFG